MDTPTSLSYPTNSKPVTQAPAKHHAITINLDIALIGAVAYLLVFGLMMVYSSTWQVNFNMNRQIWFSLAKQVLFVLGGLVFAVIATFVDYRRFQKYAILIMGVTVLLLGIVLLQPKSDTGFRPGLIGGSVQPTEMAKLAIIIYLSIWLYSKRDHFNNIKLGLIPMMIILGLTSGLVLLQGDISAAITIIALGGILFFLAGGDLRQIISLIVVSTLLGSFVFMVAPDSFEPKKKILEWLVGLSDPYQAQSHMKRVYQAIVNGGFFGLGIGMGEVKLTGIPLPWSDSIFAVIVEEMGSVGAGTFILAYIIIFWRGLIIAQKAPDAIGKLLAGGIACWIALEAFLNIGVMVSLLPFAGNTLPLISYGGSSMVTILTGIGIILGIARISNKTKSDTEGRKNGAVIDLRRRDRRRRLPRLDHLEGSANESEART
jgi:cell division protein FtsW